MSGFLRAAVLASLVAAPALAKEPSGSDVARAVAPALGDGVKAGVWVQRLGDGKVIYESSASEALLPASVTKVVTTAAALSELGPERKFPTRVHLGRSSIYIEGRGDPFLVEERVFLLARKIASLLDAKAPGRKDWELVAVPGYFDDDHFGGERGGRGSDQPYNAGVSDLSVNFNSIEFIVTPGKTEGSRATVQTIPALPGVIEVEARVQTRGKAKAVEIDRRGGSAGKESFRATGSIPLGSEPISVYRRVQEPRLFALEMIRAALALQGVEARGKARLANASEAARLRAAEPALTFESEALGDLLRGMNRYSNNFMAEQITKILGAETAGTPGSFQAGVLALSRYMSGLGVRPTEARLLNGSGLTDANRISARALGRVLEAEWAGGGVLPELWGSLAMPGGEGSMRRRVGDWDLDRVQARRIRAKTGTLFQSAVVSSIAGYAVGRDGARYAFVLILNRPGSDSLATLRKFQDAQGRLLRTLLEW